MSNGELWVIASLGMGFLMVWLGSTKKPDVSARDDEHEEPQLTDQLKAEIAEFEAFYTAEFPFTGFSSVVHFDSTSKRVMFEAWQAGRAALIFQQEQRLL